MIRQRFSRHSIEADQPDANYLLPREAMQIAWKELGARAVQVQSSPGASAPFP
jgi:hypothetical protein